MIGGVLLVLAGCGRSWLADREPWRREAEEACLKSGTVKEGPAVTMVKSISGPGVCGADYPMKVSALGLSESLGYADELRPPGSVPGAQPPAPRGYPANSPFSVNPDYPADTSLPPRSVPRPSPSAGSQPSYGASPGYGSPPSYPPAYPAPTAPARPVYRNGPGYPPPPSYGQRGLAASAPAPLSIAPPGVTQDMDEEGEVAEPLPDYRGPATMPARRGYEERPLAPPQTREAYPQRPAATPVPMSPSRQPTGSVGPATVSPNATLACPIVSALDRWILDAVQPAAQRWFAQPVVEIKQISAYSCRGMNGNPNARISEHAFGNALDIAAFKLADGHVVTVKGGWHGTPEEQGFLHDVQLAACEQFTTVLAPGSNVYHYDHIHVDLMRRASGRRICQPAAIPGEVVAARARGRYAAKRAPEPTVTGSIASTMQRRAGRRTLPDSSGDDDHRDLPRAVPGED